MQLLNLLTPVSDEHLIYPNSITPVWKCKGLFALFVDATTKSTALSRPALSSANKSPGVFHP